MALPDKLGNFVEPIISMCGRQFPRRCSNCNREFPDFGSFVTGSRPIGAPQFPEKTEDPFGLITYVNCECGSTLVLECMDKTSHARFQAVFEEEAKRTGLAPLALLLELRAEVRRRVLLRKKS